MAVFVRTLIIQMDIVGYRQYLEFYASKPLLFILVGSVMLVAAGLLGIISAIQNWRTGLLMVNYIKIISYINSLIFIIISVFDVYILFIYFYGDIKRDILFCIKIHR